MLSQPFVADRGERIWRDLIAVIWTGTFRGEGVLHDNTEDEFCIEKSQMASQQLRILPLPFCYSANSRINFGPLLKGWAENQSKSLINL